MKPGHPGNLLPSSISPLSPLHHLSMKPDIANGDLSQKHPELPTSDTWSPSGDAPVRQHGIFKKWGPCGGIKSLEVLPRSMSHLASSLRALCFLEGRHCVTEQLPLTLLPPHWDNPSLGYIMSPSSPSHGQSGSTRDSLAGWPMAMLTWVSLSISLHSRSFTILSSAGGN